MKIQPKILDIREAYELYKLIKPHFPETDKLEGKDIYDFLGEFIASIQEKDSFDIVLIFELLTGVEEDKIYLLDAREHLEILSEGFAINRILELYVFFSELTKK